MTDETSESATRQLPSQVVADAVRKLIKDKNMQPGDKLPSERDLSARFSVARNTAREAIRILTAEGLVTSHHGRGNYIREQTRLYRWGNERYSRAAYRETGLTPFRLEMQRQGKTPHVEVAAITRTTPPGVIAIGLDIPADSDSVVHRENYYYADDEPIQVVHTYIRWTDAENTPLLDPKTGPGGIYGRLEEKGHTMTQGQDDVIARMPTREEIEFFKLPPSTPVLEVLHTSIDQHGEPYEMTRFIHRADRHGLRYNFTTND